MKAHSHDRSSTFCLAFTLAKILPSPAMRSLAAAIGHGYYVLDLRYRRIVAANFSRAFPDRPQRVHLLTRRTFVNFARSL